MKQLQNYTKHSLKRTFFVGMNFKKTLLGTLALLGTVFIITACSYTDGSGGVWRLDPMPGNPNPSGGCQPVLIGNMNGCQLWDFGCDGVADFGLCDGVWHRITPVKAPTLPDVPTQGPAITPGQSAAYQNKYEVVDLDFAVAWNFDFGTSTAAQWIESSGLNTPWFSETAVNTEQFTIDTGTGAAEIAIPWRSDGLIPDPELHGLDNFEIQVLMADNSGPAFLMLRLGGHVSNVLSYLSDMSLGGNTSFEFDAAGHHYLAQTDGTTGWLYEDGILINTLPFN